MVEISRALRSGASAGVACLLGATLTACGGSAPAEAPGPEARVFPPTPLSAVYLLEATGAPPGDTTVTVTAGNARVIVIRHAPPDNAGFVEVAFDSASFGAVSGAQIPVSVRPRPGVYGIDLEVGAPLRSARVTFRYAVHFLAPAGALQKYGNDIAFERVLQIGRLDGEIVTFLPTTSPATDNLTAAVPSAGTYIVAAPR